MPGTDVGGQFAAQDRAETHHRELTTKTVEHEKSVTRPQSVCDCERSSVRQVGLALAAVCEVMRKTSSVKIYNLSSKCLSSLMYGLEACPLVKSDLLSLDFVVNRFFMKLFKTNNIDVVKTCQQYFSFEMPSTLWKKNAAHHSILSSPVPKIFSVKLQRILFKFVL